MSYNSGPALSFPLVGNHSFKTDAGQAGMTDFLKISYYAQLYMLLYILLINYAKAAGNDV
jgi:hypothetical protein